MAKFDLKSFNAEAFGKYSETIPRTRKNELIKSKAVVHNAEIKNLLSTQTGSLYATIPMFGRIGGEALNYDGATDITATNMTTYERSVIALGRAKAWKEKDFSVDITAGVDFMSEVAKQVVEYFEDVNTDLLFSILKGIFAMTGAKNLEFVNGHTLDISGLVDAEKQLVGPTTLNTAIQKASGDKKSKFTMVLMHSAVATNLENLNLLNYLKYTDANGIQRDLQMGTWNGRIVLIDDGNGKLTEEIDESASGAGDGYTKYTTYILGDGAFDYADLGVETPHEMVRDAYTNGGETTLVVRERLCYAPYGISYTKKSQDGLSPTDKELENGANWTLVNDGGSGSSAKYIDHKEIAIARIISRG